MEYSAQRVRSKARSAVKRREDQIETEEMESGELNLIPYLDMVTNLMLFLLASVSAGLILVQIDTTLPDRKAPSTSSTTQPQTNPDDQPLKLIVAIPGNQMILYSVSGLEGSLTDPKNPPKLVLQRSGKDGSDCDGPYMCESNSCDSNTRKCVPSSDEPQLVFDYRALNRALVEIATRRYAGKQRKADTYQIILQADEKVPYSTIVSTMAAMRCQLPEMGVDVTSCALPTDDENLKKAQDPISPDGKLYDTARASYDPKKMALFHEIAFSAGYE
ncbi:MAG: biopolymer transporter ExbD [Kofleriaceae bacterium]|nr:biopolymer transporter ExbD [Kofleriaceae bacterium]